MTANASEQRPRGRADSERECGKRIREQCVRRRDEAGKRCVQLQQQQEQEDDEGNKRDTANVISIN